MKYASPGRKSATARQRNPKPSAKTTAGKKILRAEQKETPGQTLQDSELRYRRLFEAAQDGVLILDAQTGKIDDVNPYLIDMLGYSRDEFLKRKLWEVGAFKDVDATIFEFEKLQEKGYVRYEDLPLRAKDGRLIEVEFVSNVYRVGAHEVIQCNIRNITDRVKAEQAAQLHDKRFRALIENASDALTLLDASGNVIYDSPALPGMLGYDPGEWIGRNVFEILHPDDLQKSRDLFQNLLKTPGKRVDGAFRLRHKSGSWMWIEGFATNLLEEPAVNAIVLNYRDVTSKMAAEEALRESENIFRGFLEQSADAIMLTNEQGIVFQWSKGAEELTGYSRDESIGKPLWDVQFRSAIDGFKSAENFKNVKAALQAVLLTGKAPFLNQLIENEIQRPDGTRATAQTLAFSIETNKGHLLASILRDITQSKQAEEGLQNERNLLRTLIDNLPDSIYAKDIQGRFIVENLPLARQLGVSSPDEAIGKTDFDYFPPDLAAQYSADDQAVFRSGQPIVNREETIVDATDRSGWVSTTKVPLRDPHGQVIGLVGIGHDITERKQAEEKLRQSNERFQSYFDLGLIGMAITAPSKGIMDVNEKFCEILGYERREILSKKWADMTHPDDLAADTANFNRVVAGEIDGYSMEKRWIRKDGRVIDSNISVKCLRGDDGSISYFVSLMEDITERKQAEELLVKSEQAYRTLFENIPTGLYRTSADGRFLDANPAMVEMFGYKNREALLAANVSELYVDPTSDRKFKSAIEKAGKVSYFEAEFKRPDGTTFWTEDHIQLIRDEAGKPLFYEGSLVDITERKQAEKALLQERNLIRTLIDIVPDIIFAKDMQGRFLLKNAADARRMGASSPEETIGKTDFDYYPHDLATHYTADDEIVLSSGQSIVDRQELTVDAAGRSGWLSTTKVPLRDAHGEVIGLVGIGRDITERKQAEEKLRQSNERFQSYFDLGLIGMAITAPSKGIMDVNEKFCEILGYERHEILSKKWADMTHPDDLAADTANFNRVVAGEIDGYSMEKRWIRKDGRVIDSNISVKCLRRDDGSISYFVSLLEDITERKQAEEAMRGSEERFRKMFEEGPIGAALSDKQYHFVRANPAFCRLLGYTEEELKGLTFKDITHPEDMLNSVEKVRELEKGNLSVIKTEKRYVMKNKQVVWGALTLSTILDPEGKFQFFLVMIEDITNRKHAEEAVRAGEQLYRNLFENMLDGFAYCKMIFEEGRPQDFIYLNINSAFETLTGLKDVVGKKVSEVIPGIRETDPGLFEVYGRVALTGIPEVFETYVQAMKMWFSISVYSPQKEYFVAVFDVITERKQAEEALRESESRFRGLFENSPISLWEEDFSAVKQRLDALRAEGITDFPAYFASHPEVVAECAALIKVLDVNKATLKLFGANRKEEMLKNLAGIFGGEPSPAFIDELTALAAGNTSFSGGMVNKTLDGRLINIEMSWTAAPAYKKSLSKVNLSMIDVTERKRAEADIKALAKFPNENPFPILRLNEDGVILYANPASRAVLEEWKAAVGQEAPAFWRNTVTEVLANQSKQVVEILVGARTFSLVVAPILGASYVNLYGRDITERKQAEMLQEAVFRIASAAVTTGSLDDLYAEIHHIISSVMNAENFYITLYDPERDLLTFPYFKDFTDEVYLDEVHPERGLTSYVLRTGKSLLCTQAVHDELERRGEVKLLGTPSSIWLGVPLIVQGQTIGAMVVQHYSDPTAYSEREQHILEYVSAQVATAINRKRAEEGNRRQLARLAALHHIDEYVSSSFDLHMTLNEILKHVKKELSVDAADVLLLNNTSLFLEYSAGLGFRTKAIEKASIRLGQGHAGLVALKRELVQIPNLKDQPGDMRLRSQLTGEDFVCYYGAPLIVKGTVKGVLEIYNRSPLSPDQEWFDFLNTLAGQTAIAIDNALLFENLERSNIDLTLAYDATIEGWSHAMDLRDKETEGHTLRVTEMTMELVSLFGIKDTDLTGIRRGALLHDIGKMGVPDAILLKPDSLTEDEWIIMKKHPVLAFQMLSPIRYLQSAIDIPYCHHEKWDGTGYPRGLKGLEIPLAARIFAIIDVWDALTSDRPYRQAWSHEKAIEYIQSQSGIHFDPEVVNVCLRSGVFDLKKPTQATTN